MGTEDYIRTIEWQMMDKHKFFPLSMLSSFTIRCILYPLTLIKTRIQIQHREGMYRGTIDAFSKIFRTEGISGLYKGFWVSTAQIFSGVFYITTYENVRHILARNNLHDRTLKALVSGGCASAVGQTIIVPFDVISQHVMVLGQTDNCPKHGKVVVNPLDIKFHERTKTQVIVDITRELYKRDGIRGFYRGYLASLYAYVPNSALWWSFYHYYQDQLRSISPPWVSHLLLQVVAAPLGGMTTTILTNPLDIVRARLQVQRLDSFSRTFLLLWNEERWNIFTKGLSARIFQSCFFSFAIVLGYESIKRMSINEEYKEGVRW
ncbi:unnamed protein product [Darwinula stevensoni]|nr:unnamed protein product [Darwinula stevensoni]CAG0886217.1 unnamed protein product [Darwinula stevensoni]